MTRREKLEERFNKILPSWGSFAYLVKVTNKFPKINGLPLNGEWTLQYANNGNLVNPLDPYRFKNLDDVEKYIEANNE